MNDPRIVPDRTALNDLLRDSGILKIVRAVNLASVSILELLEYDVTRQDISRAIAKEVIAFDKPLWSQSLEITNVFEAAGDHYFKFLSGKVKLTELGLFILETIELDQMLEKKYQLRTSQLQETDQLRLPDAGSDLYNVVRLACRDGRHSCI